MPGKLIEKWEMSCWGKEYDFIQKDRWRICLNHLIRVWMPDSFIEQRGRESEEIKLKRHLSCKIEGDVFIFSFLQSFIGELCQIIFLWAEHRHLSLIVRKRSRVPQGRLWCKTKTNENNKQRLKSKKHVDGILPVTSNSLLSRFMFKFSPLFKQKFRYNWFTMLY